MSGLVERLSDEFSLPIEDLIYLLRSAPYRYKVYQIPKKKAGQWRTIAQPARELKPIQRWVMRNILTEFPIHESAVAYRKGRNILDNASPHARHRYLCKLDFRNFFPSIKSADLAKLIRSSQGSHKWTDDEVDFLSRILFWRKNRNSGLELSIGAPSSPMVSNILLYRFDLAIGTLCNRLGIAYTRYADDMTFSTGQPRILEIVEKQIPKICTAIGSPRLTLNHKKTVHTSTKGSRRVTGLVLSNDGGVSIGRTKKREVRAAFYRFVAGELDKNETARLAGTLSFINSVDPTFFRRLSAKYGQAAVTRLVEMKRLEG